MRPDAQGDQMDSFYHPKADLLLGDGTYQGMSYATRDSVRQALATLWQDWRFVDEDRQLLQRYLEERLDAFETDTERLDTVERRDFGYQGPAVFTDD